MIQTRTKCSHITLQIAGSGPGRIVKQFTKKQVYSPKLPPTITLNAVVCQMLSWKLGICYPRHGVQEVFCGRYEPEQSIRCGGDGCRYPRVTAPIPKPLFNKFGRNQELFRTP
ncbi:hypothetical protein RSOL_490670 [Rhizoctonia solani AG-3 Rhs1AP]|uniref:Uncharacterized protein n=1 Tax=Rhizoctonia solani AG-3 Rhs1AP TaxID=1086054 RepID=X8JI28_9AGAM|nr:hypothetical protein RSOL_490670 [Rhizoctonia solani AG-3 Rhs1AP]